ncbi:MAG TPA: trypsin-like serine protease [Gemmataceae bacterium]|jgi:hypothetical protein
MNRLRNRSRAALGLAVCVAAGLGATLAVRPALAGSGDHDAQNAFPNVGAIVVTSELANPDAPVADGSGVLIHPCILLTAGHVTAPAEDLLAQGFPLRETSRISFGTDAYAPSTWVEWSAVMTHPGFRQPHAVSLSGAEDLGVVILKEPVDLPRATLAFEGFLNDLKGAGLLRHPGVDRRFVAVGYGKTVTFPPPEEHFADGLRRFNVPGFRGLQHDTWVALNMNQAAGNDALGPGDSGGPLFWIGDHGERVVVAVHSHTDPQRAGHLWDYRVDTKVARDFIGDVIAMVELGLFD